MSSELKPCPFCGGEAVLEERAGHVSYVWCKDCYSGTGNYLQEQQAIAAWNQRAERTCKLEYVEGWTCGSSSAVRCTSCGNMSDSAEYGMEYCPQCGAKVVDDD